MSETVSRRKFMEMGAVAAAAGAVYLSCSGEQQTAVSAPIFADQAPDGRVLKAGLIGCGGRGTGAALNFLSAGPNLQITALGDVFKDRLQGCRQKLLEEKRHEVADEKCFVGFDAFEKVIDSGVDLIILATPPHFRPEHFAAAVEARKHVFMEKPVAVDPAGIQKVIAAARRAESLGLAVGTGTQRRHQRDYVNTYAKIASGAIGEIVSANCYWNQSQLWYKKPKAGWSQMEAMVRDWVNWCWLSGDHIVEQHVHNLDVINWFAGGHPVKAVGFGSRQRRVTGDQYDNFSIDYVWENGMHVHSMSRQINGCANNVSERIVGTKGSSNCSNQILDRDGKVVWEYGYPTGADGQKGTQVKVSPYVQEHIDLVSAIRAEDPYVEAEATAISTLTAIMGRVSAYSGREVTWEEMRNSTLRLGPKNYALGPVKMKTSVPVSGAEKTTP